MESYEQILVIETSFDRIRRSIFHPNNNLIVIGGCVNVGDECIQGNIGFLDLEDDQQLSILNGHNNQVSGLDFNLDGTTFVTGSRLTDDTVRFWDTLSLEEIDRINDVSVNVLVLSPDSKILAIGTGKPSNPIMIQNLETDANMTLVGGGAVRDITFHPNNNFIATVSVFGSDILIWDLSLQSQIYEVNFNNKNVRSGLFNDDGTIFIAALDDGNIIMWGIPKP